MSIEEIEEIERLLVDYQDLKNRGRLSLEGMALSTNQQNTLLAIMPILLAELKTYESKNRQSRGNAPHPAHVTA